MAVRADAELLVSGQNYSVVQSAPDQACTPLPGGFNSGFIVGDGLSKPPSFSIDITSSTRRWCCCLYAPASSRPRAAIYFYCAQPETDHGSLAQCLAGMSGAINVPAGKYSAHAIPGSALTALSNVSPRRDPTWNLQS